MDPRRSVAGAASASDAKRPRRGGGDGEEMTFEDELALIDSMDGADDEEEVATGEELFGDAVASGIDLAESGTKNARWLRPRALPVDPSCDAFFFQQFDIDVVQADRPLAEMPGARTGPVPVLRMFGCTEKGHSVMVHVHGFHPFFFVPAPNGMTEAECGIFQRDLNNRLREAASAAESSVADFVLAVEMDMKDSVYGFHGNLLRPYLRITVSNVVCTVVLMP